MIPMSLLIIQSPIGTLEFLQKDELINQLLLGKQCGDICCQKLTNDHVEKRKNLSRLRLRNIVTISNSRYQGETVPEATSE